METGTDTAGDAAGMTNKPAITEYDYMHALDQKAEAEAVIHAYHRQQAQAFDDRLASNPIWRDDELRYSAMHRCPCGYGLAYPKGAHPHHYWDCAGILMGEEDANEQHTAKLPFIYYEIRGENDNMTTRGSVVPKAKA